MPLWLLNWCNSKQCIQEVLVFIINANPNALNAPVYLFDKKIDIQREPLYYKDNLFLRFQLSECSVSCFSEFSVL